MSPDTGARVDVVVVAFGPEPDLQECLESILASRGVDVRIALVDNGCTRSDLHELAGDDVVLVRPGTNLGFAAGCNIGAAALDGEHIALVNSDARVHPDALAQLLVGLSDEVGLTTACVLLADQPETVNAAGNPVQFLGISWAGGFGEPRSQHLTPRDVASISGAAAATTRALWDSLGGFDPELFLYCEDLELSLRVLQRGLRVVYVPEALVWHHYAFSRNERKLYYLERNRLAVLLAVLSRRTLLLLAPALVVLEVALLLSAATERRLGSKLEGYRWLFAHRTERRARRQQVQAQRLVGDAVLAPLLTGRIDTPIATGAGVQLANAVLSPYWSVVRRWL